MRIPPNANLPQLTRKKRQWKQAHNKVTFFHSPYLTYTDHHSLGWSKETYKWSKIETLPKEKTDFYQILSGLLSKSIK